MGRVLASLGLDALIAQEDDETMASRWRRVAGTDDRVSVSGEEYGHASEALEVHSYIQDRTGY